MKVKSNQYVYIFTVTTKRTKEVVVNTIGFGKSPKDACPDIYEMFDTCIYDINFRMLHGNMRLYFPTYYIHENPVYYFDDGKLDIDIDSKITDESDDLMRAS